MAGPGSLGQCGHHGLLEPGADAVGRRLSSWPTARSGRRCRCAAAPTWSAPSACCRPSPTRSSSSSRKSSSRPAPTRCCSCWRRSSPPSLAFAAWAVIPFDAGWVISNINVGILYLFAISSLGVYGVIMGGWASNSKYPFLSALRAAAQMVSYEVSIGFVLITVLLFAGIAEPVRHRRGPARTAGSPSRSCSRCS